MEKKNSIGSNIFQDLSSNSNLTFKRIRFNRSFYSVKGNNDCNSKNGNYGDNVYIIECTGSNPVFLMLEPEINNEFGCISDMNIKITVELIKNNNDADTNDYSNVSSNNRNYDNIIENGAVHDLENDFEPLNNSVASTMASTPNKIIRDKMYKNNSKLKNEIGSKHDNECYHKDYEKNSIRRRESIKSSIKRQLTSNPYVDICRNPEWPFTRKKNKVISRNGKTNLFSINNKREEGDLKPHNEQEQNSARKKSSRGRARQWLDSLATLFDGIYTQRSTLGRSAGLGLFSDRKFEKNEIITEFVGWVIDRNEALRLRQEGKATHICDLIKPSLYLDGEKDPKPFIGGGSFANDGSVFLGGPGNNSKFWKWYDEREGRTRVFLKATQEIKQNEEIFVGYCKDYWVDFAKKDIVKHKTNVSNEHIVNDSNRKRRRNNSPMDMEYSSNKMRPQEAESINVTSELNESENINKLLLDCKNTKNSSSHVNSEEEIVI